VGGVGGVDGFGRCLGHPKDLGGKGILARLRLCSMEYSPTLVSLMVIFYSLGFDVEASKVESCYAVGDVDALLFGMMQSSFKRIELQC